MAYNTNTVSGTTPLIYDILPDGIGMDTQIVTGINDLITNLTYDIMVTAVDDPSDSINAITAFVSQVSTNSGDGTTCASGFTQIDSDSDGIDDTFEDVPSDTCVCFDVIPKTNSIVPATDELQVYKVKIEITRGNGILLSEHNVYFVIPPAH